MKHLVEGVSASLMLLVIATNPATPAEAYFITGNTLQTSCEGNQPLVYGFMFGLADTQDMLLQTRGYPKFFCTPPGVVGEQLVDLACKYVDEHPDNRQNAAIGGIVLMLHDVWPYQ